MHPSFSPSLPLEKEPLEQSKAEISTHHQSDKENLPVEQSVKSIEKVVGKEEEELKIDREEKVSDEKERLEISKEQVGHSPHCNSVTRGCRL